MSKCKDGVEVFVVDHGCLVHPTHLVEDSIGQHLTLVLDLEAAVRVLAHVHFLARQPLSDRRRLQDEHRLVVVQREGAGDGALLVPYHLGFEVLVDGQRPMQIARVERRLGEPLVVLRHVRGEGGVGLVDGVDVVEPHRLDEGGLQRRIGALHAVLGLRRVCADQVDVQPVQRPPEMGHSVAVRRGRVVAESTVLVRVEGDRLPMPFEVRPCRAHVGKGALALDHFQVHQFTRGVVDEHQQRASWSAVLEPPMLRAVDLDQLAATVAPVAGLIGAGAPGGTVLPEPGFHHDLPQRLSRQAEAIALGKVLAREGWPEVGIVFAHERDHLGEEGIAVTPVARPSALARHEARSAFLLETAEQPVDLPPLEAQQFHRVRDPDLAAVEPHQRVEPGDLSSTHRQHRRTMRVLVAEEGYDTRDPPTAPAVPFLSSRMVSFVSSAYTA